MTVRYRWYKVRLPQSALRLEDALEQSNHSSTAVYRFTRLADTSGADEQKYRYIRQPVPAIRKSDDEEDLTVHSPDHGAIDFAVINRNEETFFRVENPGAIMRDFWNALESVVGFGFTCKVVRFERDSSARMLSSIESAKLVGLKVTSAVIAKDLVARMEFVSKSGIELNRVSILAGINYKVEQAVFECFYKGIRGHVAFSSNGIVRLSGQLAPRITHLIECDLH